MQFGKSIFESDNAYKMTPGFHLGPTFEIPIYNIFSIETSLLASTKGFRNSDDDGNYGGLGDSGKVVLSLLYVDLPITPKVTINLGALKIYGLIGPYVGVGIIGNARRTYTEDGKTKTQDVKIEWGNEEDSDGLKRLDYGLIIGAGVEIKSFQFGFNYNYGMANLTNSPQEYWGLRNRVLGVSVGYKFGKEK